MRGEFHLKVPRDYRKNLKFRKALLRRAKSDRKVQQAITKACKEDFLFFVNCFIYQYNPLIKGVRGIGPFITYGFQEKVYMMEPPIGKGVLYCYEHDRTAVVEKSREMGASWMFLIFQIWLCLFHSHIQSFNISRSADAVDSASRNSLFAKIRFIHEHLPDWMKGEIIDQRFYFEYRKTGSENTGEASTGRAGTGGRASVVFVDEFSEIKEDVKVRQNTANVAECRFFNGTHLGVGTEFYNMTKSPECVLIQMHWSRHPRKNQNLYSFDLERGRVRYWKYVEETDDVVEIPYAQSSFPADYPFDRSGNPSGGPHPGLRSIWYDKKAAEIGTTRQVAMELDINPTGSSSQFYEALVIKRLIANCKIESWRGDLDFDADTFKPYQFVPKEDGPLKLWIDPSCRDQTGRLNSVHPSSYIIAADLGTGNGATPSCLCILDAITGRKVGTYTHSWKDPKQMAHLAVSLCRAFKDHDGENAFLAWECPGPGVIFGDEVLKECLYRYIYWKTETFADVERESDTPGWFATTSSKLMLHNAYQTALKTGAFVNYDKDALLETLSYVHGPGGTIEHPKAKKNSDAAAAGPNHGDHVVADALASLMMKKRSAPMNAVQKPVVLAIPNSIAGRREYNRLRDKRPLWAS